MCGILTILNNNNNNNNNKKVDEETVKKAFELGKSRGPEGSTIKSETNAWFGFHRLAINGLTAESDQPLVIDNIMLLCNGEIYNYKELYTHVDDKPATSSDCEIIIHLYKKYGIEKTLDVLNGEFAFVLYDMRYSPDKKDTYMYIARDPLGVRPLYISYSDADSIIAIASELKILSLLLKNADKITPFSPGTFQILSKSHELSQNSWRLQTSKRYFNVNNDFSHANSVTTFVFNTEHTRSLYEANVSIKNRLDNDKDKDKDDNKKKLAMYEMYKQAICKKLNEAVKLRVVGTTERPVACLLSGGLDSSLIAALTRKYYNGVLETFSIGMKGSEDLKKAQIVANHIGSVHTEVVVTKDELFDAIPEVIRAIESYDTTTVRASVGNYLLGKYISKNSKAKVIMNGDGSDELTGGYIYFLKSPNSMSFDGECRRLLNDIHYFDVLRSDKSISSHGLEPRTAFLDTEFVKYYLGIPAEFRNPLERGIRVEKLLLREAFDTFEPELLPTEILWRKKEAFSDGVSGNDGSWYKIITDKINNLQFQTDNKVVELEKTIINPPKTEEQMYYRRIYEDSYPNRENAIPYLWMPKFVDGATDPSARTLDIYTAHTTTA
jgi:asparagine synthase (glutamine-hydrolysing)